MANEYATQVKVLENGEWSSPKPWPTEGAAFAYFEHAKRLGVMEAVAVLSRPSPDKAWQVCANARKKFGYRS